MGIWDDDPAFKSLAGNNFMKLKRLSWQCSNLMCGECDGFIHYEFKKVKAVYHNIKTGKIEKEIEDFKWDTTFESVQLEGGQTQDRENTPENSRCECHHCHGRPGYEKWKAAVEQDKKVVDMIPAVNTPFSSQYKQDELSDAEKDRLK